MRQVVARLCKVRVLVPVEAVALRRHSVFRRTLSDGQMQGHHTVATVLPDKGVRQVVARLCQVRVLVPVEAVALRRYSVFRRTLVYRQV